MLMRRFRLFRRFNPSGQSAVPVAADGSERAKKEFTLTFYTVLWKEGVVNGFLRVQMTLTLSASGDEFSGQAMADFCDANWNIVFSTTTDVKGKRLETL
jgi:hypothetical protein